jgi:hypothetical protein
MPADLVARRSLTGQYCGSSELWQWHRSVPSVSVTIPLALWSVSTGNGRHGGHGALAMDDSARTCRTDGFASGSAGHFVARRNTYVRSSRLSGGGSPRCGTRERNQLLTICWPPMASSTASARSHCGVRGIQALHRAFLDAFPDLQIDVVSTVTEATGGAALSPRHPASAALAARRPASR